MIEKFQFSEDSRTFSVVLYYLKNKTFTFQAFVYIVTNIESSFPAVHHLAGKRFLQGYIWECFANGVIDHWKLATKSKISVVLEFSGYLH